MLLSQIHLKILIAYHNICKKVTVVKLAHKYQNNLTSNKNNLQLRNMFSLGFDCIWGHGSAPAKSHKYKVPLFLQKTWHINNTFIVRLPNLQLLGRKMQWFFVWTTVQPASQYQGVTDLCHRRVCLWKGSWSTFVKRLASPWFGTS